jgi:hypothetical protein
MSKNVSYWHPREYSSEPADCRLAGMKLTLSRQFTMTAVTTKEILKQLERPLPFETPPAIVARWASPPPADECEVVATCMPGHPETEQVCLGPSGIVRHIKPSGLYTRGVVCAE